MRGGVYLNIGSSRIVVIPDGGDWPSTERWYADEVCRHYGEYPLIFEYEDGKTIARGIQRSINRFLKKNLGTFELHAQGGFGAMVAWEMAKCAPERIERIFFIGGAPSEAMGWLQGLFHRHISRLWYISPIPFFADDPNPNNDPKIAAIKKSSTECMRKNPRLYMRQLVAIGWWNPDSVLDSRVEAYFIPNGKSHRPGWWDNSVNNVLAAKIWPRYGVKPLRRPEGGFSFYSLMPAEELFAVMDSVR